MRVLVVDDNPDVRLLLERLLAHEGFEVTEAAGGPQALALLAGPQRPDVVVLDVQMPDMDGWDTLSAIRRDPRTAGLPVIICTVKGRPVDALRGWELGCDGYVAKPFDIDALLDEVRAVLSRSDAERERVRAAGMAEARRALAAADRRATLAR